MALLNMDWHRKEGFYSDGPVEDEILDLVRQGADLDLTAAKDIRWPILYHFSLERRNLLEWFPFRNDASLLEIGAGCGALTGLFCERTSRVSAVELSEKRSRIVFHRHQRAENLSVFAGNIMDMSFPEPFDYVTLIGVIEYAGHLVEGPRPAAAMLEKAGQLLKPEGSLLLAIENKFGLKYFAGARDDHTGRYFDGIEGYQSRRGETFSKSELMGLLRDAGFQRLCFHYPHPDYKLPNEIFSDEYLPTPNHVLHDAPNYDQERLELFSEKKAFMNIIRSGAFDLFANSFLVVASKEKR